MTPSRRRTVKKVGDLIGSFVGRKGEDAHHEAKGVGNREHLAHHGLPLAEADLRELLPCSLASVCGNPVQNSKQNEEKYGVLEHDENQEHAVGIQRLPPICPLERIPRRNRNGDREQCSRVMGECQGAVGKKFAHTHRPVCVHTREI